MSTVFKPKKSRLAPSSVLLQDVARQKSRGGDQSTRDESLTSIPRHSIPILEKTSSSSEAHQKKEQLRFVNPVSLP